MKQDPFSGTQGPKVRHDRDYTKFRRKMFNAYTYQQDLKPPIFATADCQSCGRTMYEHPGYPRSEHPVYGVIDCPFQFVDKY